MNKKNLDKIDNFTLNYNYSNFFKNIFGLNTFDQTIIYVKNDLINDPENIILIERFMEYIWYVFIDEIIINKNKLINFYSEILLKLYNKKSSLDKLELIINENIKKYLVQKNNINYHKIILDSI